MTDNEKKKEYLNNYKKICTKVRSLEEQIQSLREVEYSAKISKITDMPRGSNSLQDLSDYIVRLEELIEKLQKDKLEKEKVRLDIEERIAKIEDGLECDILRKRYIEFKKWEEVCVEINYSWRQTHRLHSEALQSFSLEK